MDYAESERRQEILDNIMDNAVNNPISGRDMDRLISLINKPSTGPLSQKECTTAAQCQPGAEIAGCRKGQNLRKRSYAGNI